MSAYIEHTHSEELAVQSECAFTTCYLLGQRWVCSDRDEDCDVKNKIKGNNEK